METSLGTNFAALVQICDCGTPWSFLLSFFVLLLFCYEIFHDVFSDDIEANIIEAFNSTSR